MSLVHNYRMHAPYKPCSTLIIIYFLCSVPITKINLSILFQVWWSVHPHNTTSKKASRVGKKLKLGIYND